MQDTFVKFFCLLHALKLTTLCDRVRSSCELGIAEKLAQAVQSIKAGGQQAAVQPEAAADGSHVLPPFVPGFEHVSFELNSFWSFE